MADEHDENGGDRKTLSDEAIEHIKHELIFGVGYGRPPEHTRFKTGQSGNPKGRPKTSEPDLDGDQSANAIALKEAKRSISVREGAETRDMGAINAVFRKQIATALAGNAYAQRHVIERYDRAEREQRQKIASEIEYWTRYVERQRAEIAQANAKGLPPPDPLPHPDDVVIDYDNGVQFTGPCTEEGRARVEETARFRDALIMQEALDWRMASTIDSVDPLDRPGSAFLFGRDLNWTLPERYQLSESMIDLHVDRYRTWSKRKLLKEVYRAWRALGVRAVRGCTLPPLRRGIKLREEIVEYVTNRNNDDAA